MGETGNNVQNQKPKVSVLAIVCVLIPLTIFVGSFCFIVLLRNENTSDFEWLLFLFSSLGTYLLPFNFLLGIYGVIKIKKSKGLLKGYAITTLGMLMSLLAFDCAMKAIGSVRPEAKMANCRLEMMKIGKALQVYSNDYDNHYPTVDKWCDLLVEHTDIKLTVDGLEARYEWQQNLFEYAINPNAGPNSPPDVVLLFETKKGWNKFGGPEILSSENHYRKGCNVLFNDGHAKFIKPKQLGQLRWGDKE
jgi:prepilin-type processing-associated H-X9-DG protein